MSRTRGRRIGAVAASVIAHAILLAILAFQAPVIFMPSEDTGPPQAIIPVLLTPRIPPSRAGGKPAPIRLHRRPQPFVTPPPIAPLPAPRAETGAAPKAGPVAIHPAPLPEGPTADIRAALRVSPVGCANAEAVHLTKAERDLCNERLGKGAKTAPFLGLGLPADKQSAFDRIAARKDADRRYREAPALPTTDPVHGSMEPWQSPSDPHASPDLPRLPP